MGGGDVGPVETVSAISARSTLAGYPRTGETAGPWGDLRWSLLVLEPGDELIARLMAIHRLDQPIEWNFAAPPARVRELLVQAGVPENELRQAVEDGRLVEIGPGQTRLLPTGSLIAGIRSERRDALYQLINVGAPLDFYQVPLSLPPSGFRFSSSVVPSQLQESLISLVDSLTYRPAPSICLFSDVKLAISRCSDDREVVRLLKTLNRRFSMCAGLRIHPDSNIEEIAAYWSAGGRNRSVLPLLEAVANSERVEVLDIVNLLPPVPRSLLNTFPTPAMRIGTDTPDCFSTSASFFSDEAPDRYMDSVSQVIDERYQIAEPPWQMGDLIQLRAGKDGEVVHLCNHVAGNIVFTKNGKSSLRPWILSTLEAVVAEYFIADEMEISRHRLKPEYRQ